MRPYNSGMQFELSDALVDQILFAMEDQNNEFTLDARKGIVVEADDLDETEEGAAFYPLPEWNRPTDFD